MSKVTIKMIANKMNLSVSTVNRALINKGRINEKTKEKVLKVANEMGYRPNPQAKSLSSKDALKIAVICPNDFYFQKVIEGIEAYRQENEGYRLELVYKCRESHSLPGQLAALRECAENGVNGILISPVHPVLLNDEIRNFSKLGIPTVTFNNDTVESDRIAYVGQNGRLAGAMAGELMSRFLKPGDKVAYMATDSIALGLKERTDAFYKAIAESDRRIECCGPFEYQDSWDIKDAVDFTANMLAAQKINGVYANNMFGTYALAYAIKKKRLAREVVAIGHDSNIEIEGFIRDGILSATLLQNPFLQGYQSLKLMFEHLYLKKQITQPLTYIRTVVLMQSNLEENNGAGYL